jgi:hypothetical protein
VPANVVRWLCEKCKKWARSVLDGCIEEISVIANLKDKWCRKYVKIHPTSKKAASEIDEYHAKIDPKATKMAPGSAWGRYWKQIRSKILKMSHHLMLFRGPLAPLGRFGVPFWSQVGAKGGPKIKNFLIKSQRVRKKWCQEGCEKTHTIFIFFSMRKWKVLEGKIMLKYHTVVEKQGFGVSQKV